MTYSSVIASPTIGTVGTEAALDFIGTPASTNKPPVVYAYVQSAPANSTLKTLDQLEVLTDWIAGKYPGAYPGPLALGATRAELRLKAAKDGRPAFTPDVPGVFVLRYYDVSEYNFPPTYQGNVPASGQLAFVENEQAALPAYAGGTAQAATGTITYYVRETHTRIIGQAPHTAILSITGYADTPDPLDEERVTLTPANTQLARDAALDNDVRAALLTIRQLTASTVDRLTLTDYGEILTAYSRHIALGANQTVHTIADVANDLTTTTCSDVATAVALLNDMRTKYAAHRIVTAGTVHNSADVVNVTTAAACTDFGTARTLFEDLRLRMYGHAINNGSGTAYHISSGSLGPVDGSAAEWIETPFPGSVQHMVAQCNRLAAFYTAHVRRVTAKTHQVVDIENIVTGVSTSTNESTAAALNKVADSLQRHIANLKADGSLPAAPWHATAAAPTVALSTNIVIPVRANGQDALSIQRTAEWILYVLEQHALDIVPHNGDKQWGSTYADAYFDDSHVARLAKAWIAATHLPPATTTATDFTSTISKLTSFGWT